MRIEREPEPERPHGALPSSRFWLSSLKFVLLAVAVFGVPMVITRLLGARFGPLYGSRAMYGLLMLVMFAVLQVGVWLRKQGTST